MSTPLDEGTSRELELTGYEAALSSAVLRFEDDGSPASLDQAFAVAAAAVATVRGERAGVPPDVDEVRELFQQFPDFERLVSIAAGQAEDAAAAGGERVWQRLHFPGEAPRWNGGELSRARLLVACACAPLDGRGSQWLGPRLQRLAADRWAEEIVDRLRTAEEHWWREALGERYESVRRRYAPRTAWRTRDLAELPRSDAGTRDALRTRLARWLANGGEPGALAEELEAALVTSRTPDRLA